MVDAVIDLFDQAIFVVERATGMTDVAQYIWVYNRPIDAGALREFHANLQRGQLSRLIECSPVPFGRHRWVSSDHLSDIEFVPSEWAREDFDDWLGEQASTPLDAERGPGWHLAVLRFVDGGTGISLVTSHCLADGSRVNSALCAATAGVVEDSVWPSRGSRGPWRATWEDVRHTARETPAIGWAALATIRRVRSNGHRATPGRLSGGRLAAGEDVPIILPTAVAFVDAHVWDARAQALGGTSNTLLVGLAARLAERVGRVAADGAVELTMPVNDRFDGDTRGNAVTHLSFVIDPEPVTRDLHELRATTKQALLRREATPDERRALLPIVPLLPQWLIRRIVGITAVSPIGVNSSNLGHLPADVTRPDGTQADLFAVTARYPGMTQNIMHRIGGRLQLHSGRANGRVFLTVLGYEPGRVNTNEWLRQEVWAALADFELPFEPGWH